MKVGKVFLVGAGPGDPGLITQKGLACLAKAEAVIYDRLIDERLLDSAPAEAERIYVGKAAGNHARTQDEINQLLVDKAMEGKVVVRLKGGDPFVLGRGGEEAETLVGHGISYEVIPGITSAISVPAYAGIPVTHRGVASSFAVVTGHEDPDKADSSINWEKLATGVDTLVFLMGMKNLSRITSQLINHGRSKDTPVAVIKDGTSTTQRTVIGTLEDITGKVSEQKLTPPAITVVGDVVKLRKKLRWFDNRPLFGKRVLVTRARQQASKLSRLLTECGAEPIELPAINIKLAADNTELSKAVVGLSKYHWIIFTSVNGVEAFFQCLDRQNLDARALRDITIGSIGPATAQSLKEKGIIPDFIPEHYTTEGITAGLKKLDIRGKQFLLPRADIADEKLSDEIKQLGGETHEVTVYHTAPDHNAIAQAKKALLSGELDVITFTSSSTVTNFIAAFEEGELKLNNTVVASIGPRTTETAERAGLTVDVIASEHTIPGLVTAIEKYFGEVD